MAKLQENNFAKTHESKRSDISRRPILDYFNTSSVPGRLIRTFSSREKVVEGMKTLAWVAPLTLLIWVYAEREQIVAPNFPNVSNVGISIISTDPKCFVENVGSLQPTVNLQLTGPQQAVERVKDLLSMKIPRDKLTVDIGDSLNFARNQSISVVDRIQNLEPFKSNGVTVQDAQPRQLYVNVYRMGHRDVPVLIPPSITNLTPETRFEPSKVTVSGPEESLNSSDLKVYAKLDGADVLNQPGAHAISSVVLQLSTNDPKIKLSTSQVSGAIVVTASDVTFEITDPIAIYVEQTAATLNSYSLNLTNGASIANIHVTGPQKQIEKLKDGSFPYKALLHVEPTDVGKTLTRELDYILPDSVKVTSADKHRTVEFTLTRRE